MNVIDLLRQEQEKKKVPTLRPGDTVRVHAKVVEGTRERVQVFEGLVIALHGKKGLSASFTVRRIASHGIGVERTFLLHSPRIDKIDVLRHGDVRRAKLFYLREKIGKRGRIRERRAPLGGKGAVEEEYEEELSEPAELEAEPVAEVEGVAETEPETTTEMTESNAEETASDGESESESVEAHVNV